MSDETRCEACGHVLVLGDWPYCPHGRSVQTNVFAPYFDYGLGREITSFAERWTAMRRAGLQYRDLPSKGDLSARKDRIEHEKREARHGG